MSDNILNQFEKHGRAADFLLGAGKPAAQVNAEKRITAAIALYHEHPHLQDKMYTIARGFRWNLMAQIERQAFLAQSECQRGARIC